MNDQGAVIKMEQRSPEWIAARVGSVGASRVADIVAQTKKGYSTSRANYMGELVVERLTGKPSNGYTNAAMQWGVDNEAAARRAYVFEQMVDVEEVGLVLHPSIKGAHASPDGFVLDGDGDLGLVEIKCPFQTAIHLQALTQGDIKSEYRLQMQWQMACTGRQWCDYVSFDPRLPPSMQLVIIRVERDEDLIATLEAEVERFIDELEALIADLKERFDVHQEVKP